ncbi:alpha/beta hydrolase family protein [Streptomyces sp. NBC_00335]|uniref:alpha/beta hydrolase n=1 Tax=unclassified Streptomyces TaxID=2593676 RepID=UPI002257FE17|nr:MULTISPECIES: alpha/beta hydrolase [unclassified Streptomyces]MCX5405703.1 alpha/beta hydrolase family protein [Streptomyces sp. NBC_00086]
MNRRPRPTARPDGRRGGRLRRTLLAGLVAAAVVFPVSAAASPDVPAPAPAVLGESAALPDRYAAHLANLAEAARTAQNAGRQGRAAKLRAMEAGGDARFLVFDGRGKGRAIEVFGDLETADRVAVLVPGSDTTLDTYQRFRAGAVALQQRLRAEHPRSAVVAWLGYDTPGTVSPAVLTTGRADEAAAELGSFLPRLARLAAPEARLSLLCHSYGSVVCARTGTGPEVTDIALFGSPGTAAGSAADLPTRARVWAGRGGSDWISGVPHVRVGGIGFGTDPVDPAFGALPFAAGSGGHSDYLKPGTESLNSLAGIVLGASPAARPVPGPAPAAASASSPTALTALLAPSAPAAPEVSRARA